MHVAHLSDAPAAAAAPPAPGQAPTGPAALDLRQPFADLGPEFSSAVPPEGLPAPRLLLVSEDCARLVGLAPPDRPDVAAEWAEVFSGNRCPSGTPLATVYAGHQFGNWAGQLGDGRAHLLGEFASADPRQDLGYRGWEVQLKGAGRTPYSRFGDGRAVLRSSLREFIASEAMWHLGVPTTRALCLVGSDLPVRRERMETAAVVTRLAPSFVRFGHFEHFSYSERFDALRRLCDWTVSRVAPECAAAANPAAALLDEVARRTARLVASWQGLGFVHGVLNTDNMSMLGWTLDYGPFGFMDGFDPDYTPNLTDRGGRYAWGSQPAVARWNMLALAQAMLPLLDGREQAHAAIAIWEAEFDAAMAACLQAKLGLGAEREGDAALRQRWLALLAVARADWTVSWRALARLEPAGPAPAALTHQFAGHAAALDAWIADYRARIAAEAADPAARRAVMLRVNPRLVPRHHQLQAVIEAAEAGDLAPAGRLLDAVRRPWDDLATFDDLAEPPPASAGPPMLSCSS